MMKKIIGIVTAILVVIIIITSYKIVTTKKENTEIDEYINYIKSKEVTTKVASPTYINIIYSAYKGKVSDLEILRSTTYFVDNLIPEYQEKCSNKSKAKKYFNNNKVKILKQLGIEKFEDFYNLTSKCNSLTKDGQKEYVKFDRDTIKKDAQGVSVVLCVKYKGGEEEKFNILILNKEYSDRTSVIIK